MSQKILIALLVVLLSCQTSSTKNEKINTQTNDSILDITTHREAEPFVVIKMNMDSIDPAGNKWTTVELENSKKQYYSTSGIDINFKLGDTVMIGHNAAGEYIITNQQ